MCSEEKKNEKQSCAKVEHFKIFSFLRILGGISEAVEAGVPRWWQPEPTNSELHVKPIDNVTNMTSIFMLSAVLIESLLRLATV